MCVRRGERECAPVLTRGVQSNTVLHYGGNKTDRKISHDVRRYCEGITCVNFLHEIPKEYAVSSSF